MTSLLYIQLQLRLLDNIDSGAVFRFDRFYNVLRSVCFFLELCRNAKFTIHSHQTPRQTSSQSVVVKTKNAVTKDLFVFMITTFPRFRRKGRL